MCQWTATMYLQKECSAILTDSNDPPPKKDALPCTWKSTMSKLPTLSCDPKSHLATIWPSSVFLSREHESFLPREHESFLSREHESFFSRNDQEKHCQVLTKEMMCFSKDIMRMMSNFGNKKLLCSKHHNRRVCREVISILPSKKPHTEQDAHVQWASSL